MAKGNEQATFAINLDGNASEAAKDAANEMAALRERINAGVASIRQMNGSLRNLRGSTSEVVAAKEELKAMIKSEQQALSAATLESLKHQKAQGALGEGAKKLAEEKERLKGRTKALDAAVSKAGGPIASLRDKLSSLKAIAGEGGAGGAMGFMVFAAGIAVAAVAALGAAVVAALVSLGKFVVTVADAARSAGLLREAAMGGNAQWGKNFGEQVDALSKKVPTARAEIDKLGRELALNNIGGQTWVDTMNAVTQASAALGDSAGNKLKEFIERGRQLQRLQLNPQEMIGSGLNFDDVASQLASSMHVGVDKARAALFEGRVKLADGAKAIRDAVEKKYAGINLRQMMSLDNLTKKFGETLEDLTKGVDLEPLLKSLKELAGVFDLSSESGQALKQIVSVFGNDLVGAISSSTPLAKQFLYGLILGAQELTIQYLTARNAIRKAFDSDSLRGVVSLQTAATVGKVAIGALAVSVGVLGAVVAAGVAGLALLASPFVLAASAAYGLYEAVKSLIKLDWKTIGSSIVDGLTSGLTAGWERMKGAVKGLGEGIKSTFKSTLGIHSPSTVFAEFGKHTTEGYEQGVERGRGGAQGAVDSMVAPPSEGVGGEIGRGGAQGAAGVMVNVTIHASGSNAKDVAAQVSSASVIEQLTKAIIDALHAGGIPVPA